MYGLGVMERSEAHVGYRAHISLRSHRHIYETQTHESSRKLRPDYKGTLSISIIAIALFYKSLLRINYHGGQPCRFRSLRTQRA